jgi:hypothetical protein
MSSDKFQLFSAYSYLFVVNVMGMGNTCRFHTGTRLLIHQKPVPVPVPVMVMQLCHTMMQPNMAV